MPKASKPRYIDANDLKKYALEYEFECTSDERAIFHMIENAPTVDAEPVRHGHWIFHTMSGTAGCSVCHRSFYDVYDADGADRFCRSCGAKMDGCDE